MAVLPFKKFVTPPSGVGSYGIYDTVDACWLGDASGPARYADENVAKVAAMTAEVQLGWSAGRLRARPYRGGANKLKDELKTSRTPLQALRDIERGAI